ncbi:DUF4177 domain-containing protein [Falsirhodobacter halotolerans]|uniref:DUF4177 domain-containing protein n=1 Tax=Falsirhodobacter halotolerans TaxID=1146892 RepID=UPI001FCFB05F|nr:DUF4177 domain-containing protein [Falsirhodobacter halotolerans]MCJ8139756.1 DUF4177 domain-containing protein [Falsirhodobacter halotolerans]
MTRYEYQVIPAPMKGEKARGVRTSADRFALALTTVMNKMGRDGWDYVRAETLPCEERSGWTRRTTVTQHMLVFRRPLRDDTVRVGAAEGSATDVAVPTPAANTARPLGPAA